MNPGDASTASAPAIAPAGPLVGTRVVELGVVIAGPSAASMLGEWGAEVIKIEP
ncbi:MAG: CoA transferase, partial [Ilumatobacteraceae bacterium]